MNKKIIKCLVGLAISLLTTSVLLLGITFFYFSFSQGDKLQMLEVKAIVPTIFCSLVFMFSLVLGLKYWRTNQKYLAISINILPFLTLCFISFQTINNLNYFTPFNRVEWNKSEFKDMNTAFTLLKNEELIGKSRKEVLSQLGNYSMRYDPKKNNDLEILCYKMENNWEFRIYLEGKIVREVKVKKSYDLFEN